ARDLASEIGNETGGAALGERGRFGPHLQAEKTRTCHAEQRMELGQRASAVMVVGVQRISRPRDADAQDARSPQEGIRWRTRARALEIGRRRRLSRPLEPHGWR